MSIAKSKLKVEEEISKPQYRPNSMALEVLEFMKRYNKLVDKVFELEKKLEDAKNTN